MLRAIVNVCYMFVFLLLSQIEILKNKKEILIWPQIFQKVIFSVETWSYDHFLDFTYFCFFPKSTSGAVIPEDIDLHFCTWQAHF